MRILSPRGWGLALGVGTLLVTAIGAAPALASTGGSTRLVVGYRAGTTAAAVAVVDHRHGLTGVGTVADLDAQVVTVPNGQAAAALAGLDKEGPVAYAQVDGVLAPTAAAVAPNDPYYSGGVNGQEWGETVDQANYAWSQTTGSSSVTIAIIDSGVDTAQSDLAPVLVPGWNVLTNSSDVTDSVGHGTEVAGVAAAATNNSQGVAAYCWMCRLMPVEVYNSASGASESNVASGMTWAVDHGAQVLNISLAGTSDNSVLDSAVSYALSHNVTVVAAAGNNGTNVPEYPAAISGVISVGATDQTDTLYSYSDYGSWVDVAAPGSQATTLFNGNYGSVGGTSVATPAVAGIIGLMLSVHPSATPSQIAQTLFTTSNPVQGTKQVANGRVNAYNAVTAMAGGSSSSGTAPTNSSAPTVSGSAQQGQMVTASNGSWSGSPTSFGYQWERCASGGASCADITGATASSYTLGSDDVGSTMAASVTASNSGGSASATSAPTAVVAALPVPANTALPVISGTAQSGQTLTSSTGSWSGSPSSYTYQWQHCDSSGANCASVAGATGSSYAVTRSDVGYTMAVVVNASNSAGPASAMSTPTAAVTAGTNTSTFSGSLGGKKTSASFSLVAGQGTDLGSLSFSKCSSLALSVQGPSGLVVAQTSGPSVVQLSSNLAAGTYSWTVSGSCRTSFALTVTAPAS